MDERSDPEKATRAAARYLKDLYGLFGDWNLALAGYNAGEGKVLRAIRRYKTDDYWELRKTRGLRPETKNYVPLILAAVVLAKAPERYGFTVTPDERPDFERVPIEGAFDLRVIAECAGEPVEEIRTLNPELRRLATPADRIFSLRVPPGRAQAVSACVADLPPEKRVNFRKHVVRRGQTFASIARANGTTARDVAEANNLPLQRRLRPGTELIIPIPAKPRVTQARREAPEEAPTGAARCVTASSPATRWARSRPSTGRRCATSRPRTACAGRGSRPATSSRSTSGTAAGLDAAQYGSTVLTPLEPAARLAIAAGDVLTIQAPDRQDCGPPARPTQCRLRPRRLSPAVLRGETHARHFDHRCRLRRRCPPRSGRGRLGARLPPLHHGRAAPTPP